MNDNPSFGDWLKQRRKTLGLTQHDLARRIGCALITIQKIEAGDRRPSMQIAERLAAHLEVTSEEHPAFVAWARMEQMQMDLSAPAGPHVPWRMRDNPPSNLPTPLTQLIGRKREVAGVRALLLRKDVRLVTLTGAPGIGKTRLGIQVASELQNSFADGVYFVALAPIYKPDLVVSSIAQVLGVREATNRPTWEALRKTLRNKQMLLLLDNFEQVLSAAPALAELLMNCPQLKLLVTSRAVLHLSGEHEFIVPPLVLPELERLPPVSKLRRYPSIALFVHQAQAVSADFALTETNAPAVAEICIRLDGLPLAIQLAAARSKLFSPQALLCQLSDRLMLLAGGPQDLPARQRTLRDAIGWSYDLLDVPEQTLLRRLVVFVGGCDLAAAEAVCNAKSDLSITVLDGVASLIHKSMLRREVDTDGEPRFTLLETIREYGLEQLDASGEVEAVRHQHANYYLQLAEVAASEHLGERQIRSFAQLACEQDNLRAALQYAIDKGEIDIAARLLIAVVKFWELRGYWSEARHWVMRVLDHSSALPARLRALLLSSAGGLAMDQGDFDVACLYIQESLELYRTLGDMRSVMVMLCNLGMLAIQQEDTVQALQYMEDGLAIAREIGKAIDIAFALRNLATLRLHQGKYEQAKVYLNESLSVHRDLKNIVGIAGMLRRLGVVEYMQGNYRLAQAHFVNGLRLCYKIRSLSSMMACLAGIAAVMAEQGQLKQAARLCGAVEAIIKTAQAVHEDPVSQANFERTTTMLRARLGAAMFAALSAEGQAMSLEDAVGEALRVEA